MLSDWYIDLCLAQGRPIGHVLLGQWLLSLTGAK